MTVRFGPKHSLLDASFTIQHMQHSGELHMKHAHAHDSYELFYVKKGERVYFVNDTVYTAAQGDLVFICPHDVHRTTSTDAQYCERILLNFNKEFIAPELSRSGLTLLEEGGTATRLFRLTAAEQSAVEFALQSMLEECEAMRDGVETSVRAHLIHVLITMHRNERKAQQAAQRPPHPLHQKISEIAAYLNVHVHEPVTLQDIAKRFYVSPSYVSRSFPRITGFQFKEYVQLLRIREARRLLRETEEPIGLIAERTGFEHGSNFTVTFKQATGMTPRAYRKLSR